MQNQELNQLRFQPGEYISEDPHTGIRQIVGAWIVGDFGYGALIKLENKERSVLLSQVNGGDFLVLEAGQKP